MPTNNLHSWVEGEKKSKKNFWTLDGMSNSECIAMAVALGISSGWMSYSSISADLNIDSDTSLADDYELFFPGATKEAHEEVEDTL